MRTIRHLVQHRPRLFIAFGLGVAAALAMPSAWLPLTRALAGWNIAIWSYLAFMAVLMARASHARVRKIAEQEDRSAIAVLATLSIAAIISVAAIVAELTMLKDLSFNARVGHYLFTGATVFGSWLLVATLFTFHYAHLFYGHRHGPAPLRFPDECLDPDYWDFLYFALTIAVAAQTADVSVMNRVARKTVMAQSLLSFMFNTAILGLSINIAAGIVGA